MYLMGIAKRGTMVDIWVINKSIGEKCGGNRAMVKKPPELEQGAELGDRVFEFQVFDYIQE